MSPWLRKLAACLGSAMDRHTAPLIHFLPYQRSWIEDKSRFKIGLFARQTGKTFTTCAEIVDDCIMAEIAGRKTRWVILSRGERQAKEAIDEAIKPFCKAFYTIYAGLLKGRSSPDFYETEFVAESGAIYKALEVIFPGGSRITALPANPDTARGYSANVFLDEFAFHRDSRAIWKALFPVISRSGLKLRITSTPNGKGNKFYELWTSKDASSIWSKHRVDIYDAVTQGLDRNIQELKAALADDDAWKQEFELLFLEDADAWLSYDLIVACEDENAGKPELYSGGPCFIGNDIARRRDLWVAWVWELVGDVLWTRELVELSRKKFAEHDLEIARLAATYKMVKLGMDQTGMGEKPVEDMTRIYGAGVVEGVLMTSSRRLTVATVGKQAFEDRKVRIPMGNAVLRADLHKIKKISGETGAPRLVADRDGEGHADRAWAGFIGIAAASPGDAMRTWESLADG